MPAQTPASTRSSALVAKDGSGISAHRTARMTRTGPRRRGVEDEHARAGLCDALVDVVTVVALPSS